MGDKVKTKEESDRKENLYLPTPLKVSPPPPSTVRAAPRVPCLPTPRPRWPLLLPLLPPVGPPPFRHLLSRESLGSPGCTAGRQTDPRSEKNEWKYIIIERINLLGLLQDGCPEGLAVVE